MAASESWTVGEAGDGLRLDKWLAGQPSVGSREKARQALRSGKVSVDGASVASGGLPVRRGMRVRVDWNKRGTGRKRTAGREAIKRAGITVLFEDEHMLVANKPFGLLSDAANAKQRKERDTLRKQVRAYLRGAAYPVHRIDRDTTGIVAFARTEDARDALRAQWHARTPERVYLTVVNGSLKENKGRWANWMAWDRKAKRQRASRRGSERGVLAEADYKVVERFGEKATLLEVRLVTGRRNQIRLQALLAGHPLVGDRMYKRQESTTVRFQRQALHAFKLGLTHPVTGKALRFEAPLPGDFEWLLRSLRE